MKTYKVSVKVNETQKFESALESLFNKAVKFGVEVRPTYTKSEPTKEIITIMDGKGGFDVEMDVIHYTVQLNDPFFVNGFRVLAEVHHKIDVVNYLEDESDIKYVPEHMGTDYLKCDCCNTSRSRSKSYIVRNESTNETIQVGSTCIGLYVQNQSIEKILSAYAAIITFCTMGGFGVDNDEPGKQYSEAHEDYLRMRQVFRPEQVVSCVKELYTESSIYVAKEYDDRKIRANRGCATIDRGCAMLIANPTSDMALLNDMREYFNSSTDHKDEPQRNLLNKEFVRVMDLPMVFFAYDKFYNRNNRSEFIGNVGEDVNLTLTVTSIKTGVGQFGLWVLTKFVDADNNKFSKFGNINTKFRTNESGDYKIAVGDTVKFCATVKEHSDSFNDKVTVLGRIKKYK